MTSAELQHRLAASYDRDQWLVTLRHVLPRTEIHLQATGITEDKKYAKSIFQLGSVNLGDGKKLAILEVTVAQKIDLLRNRVGLRNLVARYIVPGQFDGVLAIFRQPDASDYRFTFAARESGFDEQGQLVRRETAPRRFTYILGANESCRTAAERFELLARKGDHAALPDVVEAFNVEKLSKDFFNDFRKVFARVTADIRDRNKGWTPKTVEQEAQTLLNRLLFLYFIQRKGWLNRQRDYLFKAFAEHAADAPDGTSYYDKFLKHVFVKLSDADAFFSDLGDLPFLNGGLFDDEQESLSPRYRMKIGNDAFRHIFDDLLNAYNFTVREDTPLDQEVAIDPEMLGKIFESLVLQLEQSDTGGKTSRHDTGSYYTPRPIVHYLCREGLRAWLEQFPPTGNGLMGKWVDGKSQTPSLQHSDPNTPLPHQPINPSASWPSRLSKLLALDASDGIDASERASLDSLLTPEESLAVLNRLDDFRACDPAVGSGAFLVGLLHELVNLHRLCETRSRGKDPVEHDSEWLYNTKSRVIQRVLYGVDLQERATDICKLRLWLSLMVDCEIGVDVDNCSASAFRDALKKKVTPLPNLDYKIRRANSLIDMVRGHPIKFPREISDDKKLALIRSKLASAKTDFYNARHYKTKLRARFEILDANAELAQHEFSWALTALGFSFDDKTAAQAADLKRAEMEMGRLRSLIKSALKRDPKKQKRELLRLSRIFDDVRHPTFVWQLDFAEIFHRVGQASSLSNSVTDQLLPASANSETDKQDACPTLSGFDLILANPPYVRQEKIKHLKPLLENAYDCYDGRADLYVYFYERGVKLLSKGGVLSFISSNKFFRAGYGENLRKYLGGKTELHNMIDFGDLPIFEATAYPCILIARNCPPCTTRTVQTLNVGTERELAAFAELAKTGMTTISQKEFGSPIWQLEGSVILSLLAKIRGAGKPLGNLVNGKIYAGIKTGLNEAFLIDAATRNMLIKEDKKCAEVIKKFVKGKDVSRWVCETGDRFIIYTPHGFDINAYPAVKRHLTQFRSSLEKRALDQKWFELQQPQLAFTPDFEKTKIVYPNVALGCRFALDTGSYLDMTAFCVCSHDLLWLAILNSSVMIFYFAHLGIQRRGGYQEFKTQYVRELPIPSAPAAERHAIEGLVEKCLAARGVGCETWEQEINARVARLYGLTKDEIKLVEESVKK